MRRIKQIGALALKKSAYILPDGDETLEDFQWLLREIASEGGDAWIFQSEAVGGLTDGEIRERFRELRAADFRELAEEARALADSEPGRRRLKRRYEELRRIDFFDAPGKQDLEEIMRDLERESRASETGALAAYKGSMWVTRRGIKIDRTASAWFVRRFVDAAARFSFVDPSVYQHRDGETRFDMFEGEFTHEGGRCTFEVLLQRSGLEDAGLRAIAEIVHDLDLKETRYDRPETAGVKLMIEGLALRHAGDEERLAEGLVIFDSLYARLRSSVHNG